MKVGRREPVKTARGIPVLKMPPDLALPALRVLVAEQSTQQRKERLSALKKDIPQRTLLNAYILPSLSDLRLYKGTLRTGRVTRFGNAIATAEDDNSARTLIARHLLDIDAARVGLVAWLQDNLVRDVSKRTALTRFIGGTFGLAAEEAAAVLDRLGKWVAYLVYFGIVREGQSGAKLSWTVSRRHITALQDSGPRAALTKRAQSEALLAAYSRASMQLGTKLYLPISVVRDELGDLLKDRGVILSDADLDRIIYDALVLLPAHLVSFAPFSGPARGGLALPTMYAGFISVRRRPKAGARV